MEKELEALDFIRKITTYHMKDIDNQPYYFCVCEDKCVIIENTLKKYDYLEKLIGCPLDVLIRLLIQEKCFDKNGNEIDASFIDFKTFKIVVECYDYNDGDIELSYLYIPLNEYKKEWFLKKDWSE